MKNEEIIMQERIRLMKEGKIKIQPTKGVIINPFDPYEMITVPEEINTKGAWAKKGLKVREGEEPVTKIKIWKPYSKGDMKGVIKTEAEFYTKDQTEKMEEENESK